MTDLEIEIFKESLSNLKELASGISGNFVRVNIFEVKDMTAAELKELGREGWDESYKRRSAIEKQINRLEMVFKSLATKK